MKNWFILSMTSLIIGSVFLAVPVHADPDPITLAAQKNLDKLRYFNSRQDGIFGPKTQRAVLQYQYEMDLPITGVLDSTTVDYLKRPSIILNTQNFAPFHFKTTREGEADGPVPKIVKLACKKAGFNCRLIMHDNWKTAQEEVKNGQADGMFVIAWNSRRAQWLHRSTAIIETEYGLFVRKGDSFQLDRALQQPSILANYTIGVYGPSGTSSSLEKLKATMDSKNAGFEIDLKADDKPLFRKLSLTKRNFAVYSNRIVGESIVDGLGLTNIRYAGQHRKLSYYVGFSKQRVSQSLVSKFDEAYLNLVDQGEIISIMANYSLSLPKHTNTVVNAANHTKADAQRFSQQGPNGEAVVVDAATCLMWQQSGTSKHCNWMEAAAYVQKLNKINFSGYSDWRLPTTNELNSLMDKERYEKNRMFIHPVFDAMQQSCWSKDRTHLDIQFVDYFDGEVGSKNQGDTNFVRAVRGVRCAKP